MRTLVRLWVPWPFLVRRLIEFRILRLMVLFRYLLLVLPTVRRSVRTTRPVLLMSRQVSVDRQMAPRLGWELLWLRRNAIKSEELC